MTTKTPSPNDIACVEHAVTRLREHYLRAAAGAKGQELDRLYGAAGDLRAMSDALRALRLAAADTAAAPR